MSVLLEIKDLRVSFDQAEVVKGISLDIKHGEMMALVGESGSGKSISAYSVLGLLPETARRQGSIYFEGKDLATASDAELRAIRGKRIGMVFQEPMSALNPLHTIGRQIAEAIASHAEAKSRVLELLDQVGLTHFKTRLDAYPHQLSGGERQRVLIAIAIANNPALLIADEPTTAVDVTIQAKLLTLLKRLQKEHGMAMLFITHDLTLVKRLADRVAVMRHGEIVEQGIVSEVFAAPQHAYTKQLLNAEPKGRPEPVPDNAAPVISCEHVNVSFPLRKGIFRRIYGYTEAVKDISLSIRAGETLGVVGESGSGKTTLALALLRLTKSEGRIVFQGDAIDGLSAQALKALRKRMQIVFQDPYGSLNPRMTIAQIIEEGLRVHAPNLSAAERAEQTDAVLIEVGLTPEMKARYPHEFSGGQRQRISIARAMILKPSLVILDEPTSALDLSIQAQIIELLKRLQREYGVAYIFISHDLRVVRALAHSIIVMNKGESVEQGLADTIFSSPATAYTQELLSAAYLDNVLTIAS